MSTDRRCGNCAARHDAGGHSTCHRGPPPWLPVSRDSWCASWIPHAAPDGAGIVTDAEVNAVLAEGLTDRRIAATLITVQRRLDRAGL